MLCLHYFDVLGRNIEQKILQYWYEFFFIYFKFWSPPPYDKTEKKNIFCFIMILEFFLKNRWKEIDINSIWYNIENSKS